MDDRYRINQTSEAISASFWEVAKDYGMLRVAVDEQVAIARCLATSLRKRSGPLKPRDIDSAFSAIDVRLPPRGFARDLIARLERVVR